MDSMSAGSPSRPAPEAPAPRDPNKPITEAEQQAAADRDNAERARQLRIAAGEEEA